MLYWTAAAVMPHFREVAGAIEIGGTPSLWMVLLVSFANPIAEEFLYLGFIANVVKSNGVMFAIAAALLARVAIHVYQGPIGVVSAVATGVVFGVYYVHTGRLWPVIIAHGVADVWALGHLMGGAA
jgi:membrane protease YdiL (CAAX protease family)